MKQKIYQIDAFTDQLFSGNPAAVCPLDDWLSDETMLNISTENNLSETAFYVKDGNQYQIRWFTPTVEIDLCGHATLATAYVLFNHEGHQDSSIQFMSPRSGELTVEKEKDLISLNFPADILQQIQITDEMRASVNRPIQMAYKGTTDLLLIFENQKDIEQIRPTLNRIESLPFRGVIVTAPGDEVDFVSRFFAPRVGVPEDPVTGSAHTCLIPYWSKRLNKSRLTAIQLSKRRGYLECENLGDRVKMSGKARLFLIGHLFLEN